MSEPIEGRGLSTAGVLVEELGKGAGTTAVVVVVVVGAARVTAAPEVFTTSTGDVPTLVVVLTFTPDGVVGAEDGSGHPVAETRAGTVLPLPLDLWVEGEGRG